MFLISLLQSSTTVWFKRVLKLWHLQRIFYILPRVIAIYKDSVLQNIDSMRMIGAKRFIVSWILHRVSRKKFKCIRRCSIYTWTQMAAMSYYNGLFDVNIACISVGLYEMLRFCVYILLPYLIYVMLKMIIIKYLFIFKYLYHEVNYM